MKVANEDNSKIVRDTRKWWQLFLSYKYIISAILLVSLSSGIYISFTSVKDAIAAKLEIALKYNESNKKNYSDYTDEMTGINSSSLIWETIEDLKLNVSYFNKENNITTELMDSVPIEINVGLATPYIYGKHVLFKAVDSNYYELNYQLNERPKTVKCRFDSALMNDELKIVVSKTRFWKDNSIPGAIYLQFHEKDALIQQYKSSLSIKLSRDLAILDVMFSGKTPQRSLDFLDSLGKNYLSNTIKVQLERNEKTLNSIDKLVNGTQVILNNIEDSLRSYCHNTGLLDTKFEDQKHLSILTSLMLDKRKIDLQKRGMEDIVKYLEANLDRKGIPPPVITEVDDQFINKSMDKLYENYISKKDAQLDITQKNYINNRIDYKYDIFISDLKEYLKDAIKSTESKINFFNDQIAEIERKSTSGYSKEQLHVLDLQRQLKVNEALYSNLLEKKSNILIGQAAMPPEYRLVESATLINTTPPTNPMGPIVISLIIGLALSLIFLKVMNIYFEKIETLEDLLEKTSIPVLGEVPMIVLDDKLNSLSDQILEHPMAQAQLSSIRTNLQFALAQKKTNTILLTSHTSSEGKTFNAVSLAAILAKTKKRVLIIDFDLHRPSVKKMFQFPDFQKSMADIYDKSAAIGDCITKTSNDCLDALVSEEAMQESSEKILSEKTLDIINYAKQHYDYVVIDTPPIGIISDAFTLMNEADITLYIMNSVIPFRSSLKQIEDLNVKNKFNIRLILNKVKIERLRYYSKEYIAYRYRYVRKAS